MQFGPLEEVHNVQYVHYIFDMVRRVDEDIIHVY